MISRVIYLFFSFLHLLLVQGSIRQHPDSPDTDQVHDGWCPAKGGLIITHAQPHTRPHTSNHTHTTLSLSRVPPPPHTPTPTHTTVQEIEQDFALRQYSVIVIDEAHERSMHTDIIIGLLSRIIPLRLKMHRDTLKQHGAASPKVVAPLKLVIMSATLRVEDFTQNTLLFPNIRVPVLEMDARQYKVTTHFSKRTRVDRDPVSSVTKAVSRMHRRLPPGGILVFMTGQAEIMQTCRKLREMFPASLANKSKSKGDEGGEKGDAEKKEKKKRGDKKGGGGCGPHGEKQDSALPLVKEEEDVGEDPKHPVAPVGEEDGSADKAAQEAQEAQEEDMIAQNEDDFEIEGEDTDIDASDDEHDDFDEHDADVGDVDGDGEGGDGRGGRLHAKHNKSNRKKRTKIPGFVRLADDQPLHVLPLFSNLSKKAQAKVC